MGNNFVQLSGGGPAGSDKEVQFNDSGSFGADSAFQFDKSSDVLSLSDGQFIAGTTTATFTIDGFTLNPRHMGFSEGSDVDAMLSVQFSANILSGVAGCAKARGTATSPTTVLDGDRLAVFPGVGYDGTNWNTGGGFAIFVDGTPGSDDMPTKMVLQNRRSGDTQESDVFEISAARTFTFIKDIDAASNQVFVVQGNDRAIPADDDTAYFSLNLDDSTGTSTEFVRLAWVARDVTRTSKNGDFEIHLQDANSLQKRFLMQDNNIHIGDIDALTSPSPDANAALQLIGEGRNPVFRHIYVDAIVSAGNDIAEYQVYAGEDGSEEQVGLTLWEADSTWTSTSSPTRWSVYTTALSTTSTQSTPAILANSSNEVGINEITPRAQLHITSTKEPWNDSDDNDDYTLLLENPSETTGDSVGVGFVVDTANSTDVAYIILERTGNSSQGHMHFGTVQNATAATDVLMLTDDGSAGIGDGDTTTSRTNNFLYIPTSAGVPSGTPTSYTGTVPIVFDTSNNDLYVYDSGWVSVALT